MLRRSGAYLVVAYAVAVATTVIIPLDHRGAPVDSKGQPLDPNHLTAEDKEKITAIIVDDVSHSYHTVVYDKHDRLQGSLRI